MPAQPHCWSEIARAVRQICLHRERGETALAGAIERDVLPRALAVAREAGENDATIEARLAAVFLAETERVASALLIAELVAARASRVDDQPGRADSLSPPTPTPRARANAAPPTGQNAAPRDIADFIDEMIAQETTARPPTPMRRGS